MEPIDFKTANTTLKPPQGWNAEKHGECVDLHVRHDAEKSTFTSMWKPSPEELGKLNAGGAVALSIISTGHPPVYVGVEDV